MILVGCRNLVRVGGVRVGGGQLGETDYWPAANLYRLQPCLVEDDEKLSTTSISPISTLFPEPIFGGGVLT